jgi:hypothetical protein
VDESTLPPPDKSADGMAVFDVAQSGFAANGGSEAFSFL